MIKLTGEEDRRCDRCGVVADRVNPDLVAAGPRLVITFGLCPSCQRREQVPHDAPRDRARPAADQQR